MGEVVVETHLMTVEEFDHFWPHIGQELLNVSHIWSLHWTLDSIYTCVMNEGMQCWGSGWDNKTHVVMFTRVSQFPANRVLQVLFMFGNEMPKCLPSMVATIDSFALGEGCGLVEVVGRRGWRGFLPKEGYRERAAVFTKSLVKGRLQ